METHIPETISRLKKNLKQLDIPECRKGDVMWLQRNICIRNQGEIVTEVMKDLRILIRNKILKI